MKPIGEANELDCYRLLVAGLVGVNPTTGLPNFSFPATSGVGPVVTQLIFHTQPGSSVAGSPFGQQPVVYAADSGGNPVASFTGNVTVALASPIETTQFSTFEPGSSFVTAGAGLYLVISDATHRYGFWGNTGTETQPDGSAQGVTNYVEVTLLAGNSASAVALAFRTALNGVGFSAFPTGADLLVFDATTGARVDAVTQGACASVTITVQGTNAVLSGTLTKAAVAGVASFTDLSIDLANDYTIAASIASPALSVVSASFTVSSADPLAGFNWAARLQTHIPGSNTPLGLYKDVACTIPATLQGDSVAAWRDELSASAIVFIQIDASKRPILDFVTSVPTLLFDGIDDFLASLTPTITQPNTQFIGIQELSTGTILITASSSGGFTDDQEVFIGTNAWAYYAGATQSGGSIDSNWNVLTAVFNGSSSSLSVNGSSVSTANPGTQQCIGLRLAISPTGTAPNNMRLTSALFSNGLVTNATVETYLASLNP